MHPTLVSLVVLLMAMVLAVSPVSAAVVVTVEYADTSKTALTYLNSIRRKIPPLRYNSALARACIRHAINMAAYKSFSDRGTDGSTAASRASDAGYKWTKIGQSLGVGQPSTMDYLKTLTAEKNSWIVDSNVVDVGAARARTLPNGQTYYDVCWGAPANS